MRRPRIGVTTRGLRGRDPMVRPQMGTEAAYLRAVWEAGGLPVMLPTLPPEAAPACVEGVEGVLLTGGGDIDPARYGASRHPQTDGVDPERDAFEFALVKAAQAQGKPILGICRGSQVLAVAFGAVLCQHLPDITELTHDSDTPPPARAHPVRLEPPLELETLLRSHGIGETLEVNSYHHQGVPRRADLPPLLQPIAEAPDGVVEGFLWRSASEMIGALAVQWHPELLFEDDARHLWPFHWLVEAAQGAR